MSGSVQCPRCGERYVVPEGAAGKRVTCKRCGTAFLIDGISDGTPTGAGPDASGPARVPSLPPAPSPGGGPAPLDELDALFSASLAAAPLSQPVLGPSGRRSQRVSIKYLGLGASATVAVMLLALVAVIAGRRGGADPVRRGGFSC